MLHFQQNLINFQNLNKPLPRFFFEYYLKETNFDYFNSTQQFSLSKRSPKPKKDFFPRSKKISSIFLEILEESYRIFFQLNRSTIALTKVTRARGLWLTDRNWWEEDGRKSTTKRQSLNRWRRDSIEGIKRVTRISRRAEPHTKLHNLSGALRSGYLAGRTLNEHRGTTWWNLARVMKLRVGCKRKMHRDRPFRYPRALPSFDSASFRRDSEQDNGCGCSRTLWESDLRFPNACNCVVSIDLFFFFFEIRRFATLSTWVISNWTG